MNEQAINDLYNLAKQNGYTKSLDEFVNLMYTNDNAFNDMYSLAQSNGYQKSQDDFSVLIGKKKSEAQPQPTAQAQPMAQKPQAPAAMASSLGASSLASPSAEERGLTLLTPEKSKQMAQEAVTGTYMGSQKAAPVMKVEALPVSAPSKSEADFSSSLEEVNKDLMDYDEDYIVPKLEYLFGKDKYNFEFNWYRDAKEAIEVKAPNGKKTVIPVDAWTEKGDIESAEAFKKFLNENKPKLAKLSDEYNIYQSTIKNEQDMKKATESMNAETMQLNKIQQDLVLENTNLDKEFKYLQSVPQSERGSQDYINRLEQFNKKREDFSARLGNASQMEKDVTMKQNQLYTSIGKYTSMKAEQGGFFGGLYNSLLGGYSSMGAAATGIATDVIMSLPLELTTSPKDIQDTFTMVASSKGIEVPANMDYEKFKQWSQTLDEDTKDEINSQVKDYLTKRTKGEMLPSIRKGLAETIGAKGTTPEYIEAAGLIKGGIYGLAASLPAMSFAGAGPAGTVSAFFLQGYDASMKEMESEEFKDVSENEKYLVALPVGIVTAALEEFGMRNVLGKSGLVNDIVAKALSKSGAGTTATTFKQLVENEINSRVARGALVLTAAGLSEAETGATQAAAEIGIKELYNTIKGKDMFKTPETVGEFVKEVAVAGVQEAIGGVVMGSFNAVGTAYGENNFEGVTDETLDIYSKLANDDNARNAYAVDLKMKIVKGEITAEQGKKALDDLNNSISAFNSMPDGLAPAQQRQAFSLLRERKGLEAEIQGKDEAMVKKQKARIAEINDALSKVSESKGAAADGEIETAPSEAPSVAPSEAKPITYDQLSDEAKAMVEREVDLYQSNIDAAKESNREPDERDVSQLELLKSDPVAFLEKVVSFTSNEERKTLAEQALTKIKEEQDAIQVETAGQVPVQPTARPSEEVAQGEPQAEPQVTAQAGVEEEVSRLEQAFGGAFAETEQMLPTSVDATVLEAVPTERKMELTFTQEDGTVSPLNGNEQMASDLYQEAVAIPKAQRTTAQQSVVDMVVSARTQAPSGVSVSNRAQVAELETKTTDTNKKGIIKAATTAINTLKSIFPDMDIVIHDNEGSYDSQMGQVNGRTGSAGNFAVTRNAQGKIVGGRIDINLSRANMRTVAHEVAHAVMLKAFGDNPALFKVFRDRISNILTETRIKSLNDFASQYAENDSHEEFLVELSAALTEAQEQLKPTTVQKIAELINKVVSKITGGKVQPFSGTVQTNELIDFMNTMSSAIGRGEAIQVKEGAAKGAAGVVSKAQLATEGTGVKLSGNEPLVKGKNAPTVSTNTKGYIEDYSVDDIMNTIHAPNSRVVSLSSNIASGQITYTKDGEKITLELPYKNINLKNRITELRLQYKAIKSASKEAKAQKNKLKAEINKVAKKIISDFTDLMSQNLLALYDTLTPDFIKNSKEWYVGANRMANSIANKYNMSVEQVSGIIAVLSPQNDWFNNVSVAERTIEIMDKYSDTKLTKDIVDKAVAYNTDKSTGEKNNFAMLISEFFNKNGEVSINDLQSVEDSIEVQALILRAFDHAFHSPKVAMTDPTGKFFDYDKTPVRWNSSAEIAKAIVIYRNGDISNINENLGDGNKVRNFYNNIVDPNSQTPYVTADTHALSAALNSPMSANDAGGFGLFNGSLEPLYAMVKGAYINAANIAGIMPREMQSITWEAQRIGINDKSRTEETKNNVFDYIAESRKNKQTPYERATELIARNRSGNPSWGKSRGIETQKSSEEIRRDVGSRANKRIGSLSDLRGRTKRGLGKSRPEMGGGVAEQQGLTTVSKAQKEKTTKFAEDEKGKIRPEQGGDRTGRYSSGSLAPLTGAPNFQGARGPDPELVAVAEKYAQENGIDLKRQAEYVSVDEDRAKRIADAYEQMAHNPNDPKVREAYADLITQTKKQYQALADAGYVFSFFDSKTDPYNGNPVDAMRDLRNNKRMAVYGTYDGYGTEGITKQERENNPMLEDTGLRWKDQNGVEHPVTANDLFRAVHDAFGHGLEGAGFRARGEENAWQAHVRLFTGPAVAAITTETRGQNSWLNYGPFGEQNRNAKVEDTVFADNKTGLMPEWTWTEGRAADMPTTTVSKAQKADQEVRKVVKDARAQGYSEEAIKAFLVKKGFTAQEADTLMSKPEAGKKIELGEELMEGYDRMMAEVDGIIERGLNRNAKQETILANVLKSVENSDAYKNGTDIQREQIVREVKQAFGEKMKSAPSVGKILGTIKDIKNITMSDAKYLKQRYADMTNAVKDHVKAWNKANKQLMAELKEMVRSGKINTKQAVAVLRKFANTNLLNQDSIDSFISYMARVFADANYAERISNIRKNLKAAKRNIQTKIGVAESVQPLLQQMLSINPTLIPESVFDKYEALVSMLGQRKAVLELRDIDDVLADVTAVMDAVTAEVSKVPDLAERFESYADKVVDEEGKVQYSETVDKMLEEDVIDASEAVLMRKYKSKIMPAAPKAKMTEAEIAQEKQDLIAAIKATRIEPSKLALRDERDSAFDLSDMIDDNVLEAMDNKELKTLLAVIGNINNGYMPHQAQLMKEVISSIKDSVSLNDSVVNAKPLSISKVYAKIKSIFTRKDSLLEMVRRSPLTFIDQVFGDFKTKNIFKSVFEKASQAQSSYKAAMTRIQNRLDEAYIAVSKSFGNDPAKVNRSSYRMMAYMLQLEHQTNPAGVQTKHSAMDYLKKTIDSIRQGKTSFSEVDAEMLQDILNEMNSLKDADGNVDLDAFYSTFNKAEKNAIKVIQDVNIETRDKALYTSAVIRGDKIAPLNNYVHHNTISDNLADENISGVTTASDFNSSMQPSTKGKSLIKRSGALLALDFDVFASAQRGANFVMMDYHLTEPIRTARKTINRTRKNLEVKYNGRVPEKETMVLNAIENAFEEATSNLLMNNIISNSFMEDAVQEIARQGYRAVLASAPRWVGELVSNMGFAMLMDRKALKTAYGMSGVIMSSDAPNIMMNLKSKQTARMFSSEALSGRFVDTNILNQTSGKRTKKSKNGVANKVQQIYNNSIKKYKNSVEFIADTLITTPDKIMMRPVWFGAFANEFKRITGNMPDFDMIAENNEAYMNENKEALKAATEMADTKSTFAGATDNAYMGILKGTVKPNQSALTRGFNMFNNYMSKFLIFEYTTARTAINAAMGNGHLTRKEGAALLAAVSTRMVAYTFITGLLSSALAGLFGDEDEEDEKSMMQKIGQAMASGASGLLIGRDFGNATKTILNYGVERINEKYLDALREGDYDPYKDAIAFSAMPPEKKGQQTDLYDYIKNMAGPFGPILKTADLAVKKITEEPKKEAAAIERAEKEIRLRLPLEILGNLGFIPLYKDIRKIVLKQIYKDLQKAKGESKKQDDYENPYGISKTDMKKYFPEMYNEYYGPNNPNYQIQQMEAEIDREIRKIQKEMKESYYGGMKND